MICSSFSDVVTALREQTSNASHQRGRGEHSGYDEKFALRPPVERRVRRALVQYEQ
jgi:hypothetical protein